MIPPGVSTRVISTCSWRSGVSFVELLPEPLLPPDAHAQSTSAVAHREMRINFLPRSCEKRAVRLAPARRLIVKVGVRPRKCAEFPRQLHGRGLQILAEPSLHFAPPELLILRLLHPVSLIR